jgi:cob(I)alamin adenosyltransferase
MKIAVINFSGNVGKSTVARHLLLPRVVGADLITVESLNATEGQTQTIRGRQFAHLQEYLQTVDSAVVDIGASNVEQLLDLMRQYRGSHEDFDAFVVPTVPAFKQQQDTIATLVELSRLGVPSSPVRLLFNMVDEEDELARTFQPLLSFVAAHPVAQADLACRLGENEIYARLKITGKDIAALAQDQTDYKALIAKAADAAEKLALAQRLATRRLAHGVLPELDACFAALHLETVAARAA